MRNISFWELLSTHRIEIPVIQRDYAQGRASKTSSAIRESFIASIVAALKEEKVLHLNFVYGKIKGGKNSGGGSEALPSFLPLDGQQRLTTLFLLHCYLYWRISARNEMSKEQAILKNFSYSIRPSSEQFCKALIKASLAIAAGPKMRDQITDAPWFFQSWEKDPTVTGMLTVLEEIHAQLGLKSEEKIHAQLGLKSEEKIHAQLGLKSEEKIHAQLGLESEEKIRAYWERLTNTTNTKAKSISFELLDLEEFQLTDELYVKMNSRGKSLTYFENFKASLMEYISQEDIAITDFHWEEKLDTTWADLFWAHKDPTNMLIDEEYLRFFRNMMQIHYVLQNEFSDKDRKTEKHNNARQLASEKGEDGEYIFMNFEEYKSLNVLTEASLKEIFHCLDLFAQKRSEQVGLVFKNFVTGSMTMADKLLFYALFQFLKVVDLPEEVDLAEKKIASFIRVYRNLIVNNQLADDDFHHIRTILKGIEANKDNFNLLYQNLAAGKSSLTGFRESQIKEERLKAALLCKPDLGWQDLIIKAEAHPFFNGQIGFLFALCGLLQNDQIDDVSAWDSSYEQDLRAKFQKKLNIAELAFENFSNKGRHVFDRALLTMGDYLHREGQCKRFWSNDKNGDQSWHCILRKYNSDDLNYKRAWNIFSTLISKLEESKDIQSSALQMMIDDFEEVEGRDWRYCFIKYPDTIGDPDTIGECGESRRLVDQGKEKRYLGAKADRSNTHLELESYRLFILVNAERDDYRPFKNIRPYACSKRNNGFPCTAFDFDKEAPRRIALDVSFHGEGENEGWKLRIFARQANGVSDALEPFKNILAANEFTLGASNAYFRSYPATTSHADIAAEVKKFATALQTGRIIPEQ